MKSVELIETKKVLSRYEAAKLLGISNGKLDELRRTKQLPTRKCGRRVLILKADIDSYLESLAAEDIA